MRKINRRGILILITGIVGIISLLTGVSFAVFSFNFTGTKQQAINVGCLKVEMTDNGTLNLANSMPLADEDGLKQDPYVYTIENTCSLDAYYETTINIMSGSNELNASKTKVALSGDSKIDPIIESKLPAGTLLETNANVIKTYKLDDGYLKAGETKTFELRTWIDYDVEQISGRLENKIIVNSISNDNKTIAYYNNTSGYNAAKGSKVLKDVNYKQPVEKSGVVKNETGTGVVYNFRGNPKNNIQFGSYNSSLNGHASGDPISWKILSTNEDGSINIITTESIASATYTNSATRLTTFYNTHLSDEESYIKTTSTFCKEEATNGEYLAKLRTENNNPTTTCNGTTVTKIGLPTVDDLMFAGEAYNETRSTYLSSSTAYMTNSKATSSTIYRLTSTGINTVSTGTSTGIRAVITLSKDVKLGGSGTEDEPFYVTGLYTDTETPIADTTKPTVIYARVDEDWSNQNKKVEISAKDNQNIAAYIVKNSNTTPSANDSSWEAATSNKYTTVSSYDNGTYYVFVKDSAGNISDPKELLVERVDKVAPTCTINIISDPDRMNIKTLSIESNDTNIDLKGYSWEDDSTITTATRRITQRGTYTAYLKDLAGNTGSCDATITGFSDEFEVTVLVNNGSVDTAKKNVLPNANASFNLTSNQATPYHAIAECTHNQNFSLNNNVFTVSGVTHDTECTVTYKDAGSTVLYTDGTLIINELPSNRQANIALHGAVTNEYVPMSNSNRYAFRYSSGQPWNSQKTSITRVEIGQMIQPTNTSYWFYGLENMTYGDFTNINTSMVTNMSQMFYNAGYNATSFTMGDLSNWDVSNVTTMFNMFSQAGQSATTFDIGDLSNWNTSNVTNMSQMFYQAGYNATSFTNIGALDIYATDVSRMFNGSITANAILDIYSEPVNYDDILNVASTSDDALIIVNYYCGNTVIDDILATKSSNSNVVKGIEFGCSNENEFPVTLDAQGGAIPTTLGWQRFGNNKVAVKPYVTGNTYGELPTPVFRNYEFLGWYTKAEGGTQITSSTEVTKTKGHTLYAHWSVPDWTVNVNAVGGSVTENSSKTVKDYSSSTFNLSTELESYTTSVSCTNNQKGSITNNVLTVKNVTNNTTCTVTYSDAGSTVLYTDGTLIINEKSSDRSSNITKHGAATYIYAPMSNSNNYVFSGYSNVLWYPQRANITRVEIGQKISPTDTKYWFYGLTNVIEGDFTNLDTSSVTSMSSMFSNAGSSSSVTSFTLTGLDNWDTSKVTTMNAMFNGAGKNATTWSIGNLSNWDTSQVTGMTNMFSNAGYSANIFDIGGLSNWDTSNVTTMQGMFQNAGQHATTWSIGDLSDWDTSSVTSMFSMFSSAGLYATTFDIGDLSNWDTSKVTSMSSMFSGTGENATTWSIGDLSNWDVSNVTDMSGVFGRAGYSATTWSIGDLSNWDTSNVKTMSSMFSGAGKNAAIWNIGDLSNWDTSNVTDMSRMFDEAGYNATTFNIGNLSNWDTSNVTNMSSMFASAGYNATTWSIGDLSNWDTRRVTNMSQMFAYTGYSASTSMTSIGTLYVYATDIDQMFSNSRYMKATLNIYSEPNSYANAFNNASILSDSLITVNYSCRSSEVIDAIVATKSSSSSNVVRGTNLDGTCSTHTVNVTVNNGTVSPSNKTVAHTSSPTFTLTPSLSDHYVSSVTCTNNQKGSIVNNVLTIKEITNDTACTVTYSDAGTTTLYTDGTLIINEKSSDRNANITAHGAVTNEYVAFQDVGTNAQKYIFTGTSSQPWGGKKTSITRVEIGQPISPSNTAYWFYGLTKMVSGSFANLDTSNVTSMYQMFFNAGFDSSVTSFTLTGLNNWDTSKVTTMYQMFNYAGRFATTWSIGDLSNWDTSKVTNMHQMLNYAGYNASVSMTGIGTLDVYATSIQNLIYYAKYMNATINIYNSPTNYTSAFSGTASQGESLVTVNYNCTVKNIDAIIATKSSNSNVVKGSEIGCEPDGSTYTVTADPQGGTITNSHGWTLSNSFYTKTVGYANEYGNLPEASRANSSFDGWYSSAIGGTEITNSSKVLRKSDHKIYAHYGHDVNLVVANAIIDGDSSKTVGLHETARFKVTPNNSEYDPVMSCTNGQNIRYGAGSIIVPNVTANTTCTVTFSPSKTVLYTDGTFIINESASDRSSNITAHGAVIAEYDGLSNSNSYVFNSYNDQPWASVRNSIKYVEIGKEIKPTSTSYWFERLSAMQTGDFSNLNTSNVVDMSCMFAGAGLLSTTDSFVLTGLNTWDVSNVVDMNYMFFYDEENEVTTWNIGDISNWNTSSVENMSYMFSGPGYAAGTMEFDLSKWDVSNVTNMAGMFSTFGAGATTWSVGNLSDWDVSSVTDMSHMFEFAGETAASFYIGDLSNWDTSNVTNMSYMFANTARNATRWNDIGALNVYADNITYMFNGTTKAKATLNIYSNPTSYSGAFTNAATSFSSANVPSSITVDYGCNTTNIDNIIATKSTGSNIIKNTQFSCSNYTVNTAVTNGTISGSSTASVAAGGNPEFTITPNSDDYLASVSCTNGQNATYKNGVLKVYAVNNNTTCTVNFHESELNFGYTGDVQLFYVPKDGYYFVELGGASGGSNSATYSNRGAQTSGYIYLEEGEKLYVYVGQKGTNMDTNCRSTGYEFNGGGIALPSNNGKCGATGGGATDVRLVGGSWYNSKSLLSRIMVAGAGSGSDSSINSYMGSGGTLYGEKPNTVNTSYATYVGLPGTQISGGTIPSQHSCATSNGIAGSFGKGGSGGASQDNTTSGGGSGGGAGYYGGSGASGLCTGTWSGGGGSSYISGYAGVNSVNTSGSHTNQTIHYSGKYFVGGDMISAQNSGNGYGVISYVGNKPARRNSTLNSVRYIKNCTSYSTANNYNHWTEIQAIVDGVNIAKNKSVYSYTTAESSSRPYSRITDGDITSSNYSNPETAAATQCVAVDLEDTYSLDEVAVWNYFGDQRAYYTDDVTVSSNNSSWTNISNNEVWIQTSNGYRYNAYIDHINGYTRTNLKLWYDGYANNGASRTTAATTWKNLAGSTLNGTPKSGTTNTATWGSKFMTFDGTDDWVGIAAMNYSNPSIETVISPTKNHTTESDIVTNFHGGGYGIYLGNNNSLQASYYLSSGWRPLQDTSGVSIDEIVSASTSYNSSSGMRKLYKNGSLFASDSSYTGSIGTPSGSTIMMIGANPNGSNPEGYYFGGRVYSVRIYQGVLTDAQVQRNYLYDKQLFNLE